MGLVVGSFAARRSANWGGDHRYLCQEKRAIKVFALRIDSGIVFYYGYYHLRFFS